MAPSNKGPQTQRPATKARRQQGRLRGPKRRRSPSAGVCLCADINRAPGSTWLLQAAFPQEQRPAHSARRMLLAAPAHAARAPGAQAHARPRRDGPRGNHGGRPRIAAAGRASGDAHAVLRQRRARHLRRRRQRAVRRPGHACTQPANVSGYHKICRGVGYSTRHGSNRTCASGAPAAAAMPPAAPPAARHTAIRPHQFESITKHLACNTESIPPCVVHFQ